MKQFDEVIKEQFGIIHGKGNLVFIKTGKGGTIEGYEGKYLNICGLLYERYGCSIVVSANPEGSLCDLETEFNLIDSYVKEYDEIYYIGISNGASVGAQQCWKIDKIKNALLINGPLMVNWHRIKVGVEKFIGKHMCFAYGEKDPSIRYIGLLETINNAACKYEIIDGEGHNFSFASLESEIFNFIRLTMS